MAKISLTITVRNGQIIITPPPGVELDISHDSGADMTIAEAAERFGVNRNTLAMACSTGAVPSELRGRNRFVRESDVLDWANTPRRRGRRKKEGGGA